MHCDVGLDCMKCRICYGECGREQYLSRGKSFILTLQQYFNKITSKNVSVMSVTINQAETRKDVARQVLLTSALSVTNTTFNAIEANIAVLRIEWKGSFLLYRFGSWRRLTIFTVACRRQTFKTQLGPQRCQTLFTCLGRCGSGGRGGGCQYSVTLVRLWGGSKHSVTRCWSRTATFSF